MPTHRAQQVGAQRLSKSRVIDLYRNIGAGALAGAIPSRTDFDTGVRIAKQNAPVGRIFAVVCRRWNKTTRTVSEEDVSWTAWDFAGVDVSPARDPQNRLYFWLDVPGSESYPNVWVYGADIRTSFPVPDVPARSCE